MSETKSPYQAFVDLTNEAVSRALLGQTGATVAVPRAIGSRASAEAHREIIARLERRLDPSNPPWQSTLVVQHEARPPRAPRPRKAKGLRKHIRRAKAEKRRNPPPTKPPVALSTITAAWRREQLRGLNELWTEFMNQRLREHFGDNAPTLISRPLA